MLYFHPLHLQGLNFFYKHVVILTGLMMMKE